MEWASRLNQALEYIEANLHELDYEAISRITLCPVSILQRFFALNVGVTLHEYVRCRRLSEAGLALQFRGRTVMDAALDCGYESPDSFGQAFKKFHGLTPTEARKAGAVLQIYPRFKIAITITRQKGDNLMEKIQALNAQIAQDPENALPLLERMEAYFEMKEYRLAIADTKNALEQWETDNECDYIRYDLYEADLNALGKATPSQVEAFHLHLQGCFDQMRARYVEAANALTKAIVLVPNNPWFYHTRCKIYGQLGNRWDEALQDIQKAVALNPNAWQHYDKRGWCQQAHGNAPEVIKDWGTALQLGYTKAKWLVGFLCGICDESGLYAEGLRVLLELQKAYPHDFDDFYALGHIAFHGDLFRLVE